MSELNYEKVFNVLVQKTKDYIVKNNLKSMVLGISGGTAWAVQMAIDEKKPVFVFNQYDSTWLLWDYSMKAFREYRKTPTLTRNFAGIGTRNLQANGLQAIIDCYTETTTEKTLFD
jgi:hypothetical protein